MNESLETVTRHQITLEGLAPYWALLLGLALGYGVWRLYARELAKLPPRTRRWIRGLRLAAVGVVVLAFMNPTWEVIRAAVQKPLVALAVDTSRSMELSDTQAAPAEQVRLALALGVLPRASRSAAAAELAQVLLAGRRDLEAARAALQRAASRAWHAPAEPRTAQQVTQALQAAEKKRAAVRERLRKVETLGAKVENALAGEAKLLRRAGDARLETGRLGKVVLEGFLPRLYRAAQTFEGTREDIFELREAALETADSAQLCLDLAREYEALQERADEHLLETADAGTREKIRALAKLSRREIMQRLLGAPEGLLAALREHYRIRLYGVNDTLDVLNADGADGESGEGGALAWKAGGSGTDWGGALRALGESLAHENLAGVLLFSDGRHTEGPPPQEQARAIAALGVPLHTVGIGSTRPPLDVALVSVQAPRTLWRGESLAARAFVRTQGFAGRELRAVLYGRDGKKLGEAKARPKTDGELLELAFPPCALPLGTHRFEVALNPLSGEADAANNRLAFSVRVIARRLKVLLAEGLPRWQQIELSASLRANPNVALREVILGTQPERKKEINAKYEVVLGKQRRLRRGREQGTYPKTREDLFDYDVLFLGDFPVLELSFEEQKALADFVRYKGGSLVLLAGRRYNPYQYEDSALGGLLPVILPLEESDDEHLAFRPYFQDGYRLALSPAGRSSPLCQLQPDEQANLALWPALPRSYWRFPGLEARPGSEVLAWSADARKEPLLVTRQVGLGRVLYVGLNDLWRWKARDPVLAKRFWRGALRWAISGGLSGREKHLGLATDRRRYGVGEAVIVGAQVLDEDGYGLDRDIVRVSVHARPPAATGASGEPGNAPPTPPPANEKPLKEARLEALEGSPGLYRGRLEGLPEGRYELRLRSAFYKQESAALRGVAFSVGRDPFLEHLNLTLNRPLLEEIAQEGGGAYFSIDRANELLQHLPKGQTRSTSRRHARPLWDNAIYLLLLLSLFTAEWLLRKTHGLL